ncbi:hypothetical protein SKAU_G00170140 [Synaphobranchus kaupii]|uniref:Uncharacterized protein n=1 Tax=Synaphobranchus kaupii TaxID=118154 RepID=A0A9Q1FKP6_SYNKA|nr:hypothetical protein SKAU_G00170140 [Synaphobranchus kaupii]
MTGGAERCLSRSPTARLGDSIPPLFIPVTKNDPLQPGSHRLPEPSSQAPKQEVTPHPPPHRGPRERRHEPRRSGAGNPLWTVSNGCDAKRRLQLRGDISSWDLRQRQQDVPPLAWAVPARQHWVNELAAGWPGFEIARGCQNKAGTVVPFMLGRPGRFDTTPGANVHLFTSA